MKRQKFCEIRQWIIRSPSGHSVDYVHRTVICTQTDYLAFFFPLSPYSMSLSRSSTNYENVLTHLEETLCLSVIIHI